MNTVYQQFIHQSRYARFLPNGERESWEQSVQRTVDYLFKNLNDDNLKTEIYNAILNCEIMPSMRLMMTSGDPAEKENICGYNCCAFPITDFQCFPELLYILMCGTGVGYSVRQKHIQQIESVPLLIESALVHKVEDSRIGWATAFKFLLETIFESGLIPKFDYSAIRAKGKPLKAFGIGYSSGSECLKDLFDFTIDLLKKAQGRQLTSLECHSICTKVASIVVCGGVRRSALLSLSDLEDLDMAKAKSGQWWVDNPHFALANNSAYYTHKPTPSEFLREASIVYDSFSGERGMVNNVANQHKAKLTGRREWEGVEFIHNPCVEINLRSWENGKGGQFCNLSEVVLKPYDTEETILRKIELATIIGTIQSSFTKFNFIRDEFRKITEKEALLGVSLTGIYDCPITANPTPEFLTTLKSFAVTVNKEWAEKIGVNQSVAITTVKPSGTVSNIVNSSAGLHPRYSQYYIRRVRSTKSDPISKLMMDSNVPYEEDFYTNQNWVFSFPMKAPENSITTKELTALEHFKLFRMYNDFYTEHKPSITISYSPDEYLPLMNELYTHFDTCSGISILPRGDGHTYKQAPYEAITEEEYNLLVSNIPTSINWKSLVIKEISQLNVDLLNEERSEREYTCVNGQCEV
jgi:ribonucleoside-triphosphate reductase